MFLAPLQTAVRKKTPSSSRKDNYFPEETKTGLETTAEIEPKEIQAEH